MNNIINLFIENPEKEYHVREIARKLRKSPTTVSKLLKEYEKNGLLISERKMNHLVFKANTGNRIYKIEKLHYNLTIIVKSGLLDYLINQYNHPEAIILFGSFAKADNNINSDIDLFILTPTKKELILSKYEKKLGHPIQILTASRKDIENMKTQNKELLNNIINGIPLEGSLEVFR